MLDWVQGKTFTQIARDHDIAMNTVRDWRAKNQPENWDEFAERFRQENLTAAKNLIQGKFLDAVTVQLDSSIIQSAIVRRGLNTLYKNVQDGNVKTDDIFSEMRNATIAAKNIQDQQSSIFGTPNVRVSEAPNKSPHALLSGRELSELSTGDLIKLITVSDEEKGE